MLEIHDLRKTFGETVALDGCSFIVDRGRVLGFLGPAVTEQARPPALQPVGASEDGFAAIKELIACYALL